MRFRAVLFDCDGVLVNSEPAHYEAFRATPAAEGRCILPGLDGLSVADVTRPLDAGA